MDQADRAATLEAIRNQFYSSSEGMAEREVNFARKLEENFPKTKTSEYKKLI